MAGRRVYGGSSMKFLLQNDGMAPDVIEALLASRSSPGGFQGSRSMVNFEDVCGYMSNPPIYGPHDLDETGDEDMDECLHQPEKKRRLTAHQVQFLERCFELENKLEPERKIQLAKDLGLQPRQVAIWFQNRRARWKTKQMEKDYEALKSRYNVLKVDYEQLLKEKEKFKTEVAILTDKLLLKKNKAKSKTFELNKSPNLVVSGSKVKTSNTQVTAFKEEDLSSGDSAMLDSDSSHCAVERGRSPLLELTDCSNAIKPDQSNLSNAEEDEDVKDRSFLRFQDHGSYDYEFPAEDQAFWLCPY